jgi:DNA-binding transcriptional ArsR family regulator
MPYAGAMIDTVLQAVAEPRRREIMRLIHGVEQSSGEIASHFAVSRPAISQHLRVLEHAGLVSVRAVGTRRLYTTRPAGLAEIRAYLDEFWDDHLLLLKQAAEAEERRASDARTT